MFGLTFEKLFLVVLVAGVVIGPRRLPDCARQLATALRDARAFLDASRARAEDELGVGLTREQWEALDPRRYDPRRIVRDVMHEPPAARDEVATGDAERAAAEAEAVHVRPGQRYLVVGSAAHPRRILIDSLPADDPRRRAAHRDRSEAVPTPDGSGAATIDEPAAAASDGSVPAVRAG